MTTQKKKKSAKQRRVLIGSVVVAAAIVAGSTFAWFSSKDEVTNRLTASANYNVSIVEDFQPPAEWLPGQTINKDVSAVNTGNVDAFVRMWLGGAMRVLSEDTPSVSATSSITVRGVTKVDDAAKTKLGLNYSRNHIYFKTLSTEQTYNPILSNNTTGVDEETNQPAQFSEVQSMQAAGVLVYAPNNAAYHWTLEQAADFWVEDSNSNPTSSLKRLPKNTVVGSVNSTVATEKLTAVANGNYYGAIDASTFQPESTGLYLFRRNIGETADGTPNTYEYSGYYFVKSGDQGLTEDAYFALHTAEGSDTATANHHSDYVLPKDAVTDNSVAVTSKDQVLPVTINNVYLYTAKEDLYQTDDLTWVYDNTPGSEKFTVTKVNAADPSKNIVIDIALANIGTTKAEAWTAIEYPAVGHDNKAQRNTFYYNNDLEAGDTTVKLVDNVTLSSATENGAYLAFDFDLNVYLDSIQVTMDSEGNETNTTIMPWAVSGQHEGVAADDPIMQARGATTNTGTEITSITWTRTA